MTLTQKGRTDENKNNFYLGFNREAMMAFGKCFERGKEVPDAATKCSHCGAQKPTYKERTPSILNILLVAALLLLASLWQVEKTAEVEQANREKIIAEFREHDKDSSEKRASPFKGSDALLGFNWIEEKQTLKTQRAAAPGAIPAGR